MRILNKYCFRLDNVNVAAEYMDTSRYTHVDTYISEVISEVLADHKSRKFKFSDDESTKQNISNICSGPSMAEAQALALKLAQAEHDIKNKHPELRLDETIKSGIAIIALVEDEAINYFFFVKADDSEVIIIRDGNDELSNGLVREKKQKRYRAFIAEYDIEQDNGEVSYGQIVSLDKTSPLPKYWIENFLHLTPVYKDEEDTKKAFKALTTRGLNKIRDKHPYAHTVLSNMVIGEFSSDGQIIYSDFVNRLCASSPDRDRDITETLKNELLKYPEEIGFDDVFNKKPEAVKNRKTTIKLNEQIDLVLKDGINIDDGTIKAVKKNGVKYLVIRTEEGYNRFHKENAE